MKFQLPLFLLFLLPGWLSAQDHLLITEFAVTPTDGEFIEIHNPTAVPVDLTNYYLTDATFVSGGAYYYNIVTGANAGGGGFGDFHARFPAGASIAPGEFLTIAMNGSGFLTTYGTAPSYELFETDPSIPNLLEALPGSINNQGGLTNAGEVIILYTWDGQSDLVQDVDYVVWGDKVEAVDKTGVSIDGPDPGSDPSTYLNDTAIAQQISVSPGQPHNNGESRQRLTLIENGESTSGGNGLSGHDETSEDLATSFQNASPNPGSGPGGGGGVAPVISNVQNTPANPTSNDAVTVSADVTDDGTVTSVKLHFSFNGGAFDSTGMSLSGGNTYQAGISAQPEGTVVSYFVSAVDNEGLRATSLTRSYTVISTTPGAEHLLISELVVTPSNGEFIEIFNPTGAAIDLSDYYLTDGTFAGGGTYYYNIVTGSNAGGGDFGDFHARFPAGASIAAGAAQTVAFTGSGFQATYGVAPTYELFDTDGTIPDMREALPGSINGQGSLTNDGEVVVLYFWDGQSDLVQDIDYVLWGDKAEAVDKSGVSIDGPDPGSDPSTYANDTPIFDQIVVSDGQPHQVGESVQRLSTDENGERLSGGNGITGHDETSENLAASFPAGAPTPNMGPLPTGTPVITNLTRTPAQPTAEDDVVITADISDDGTIVSARLLFSIGGAALDSSDMNLTGGNTYEADIPAQPQGTTVQYFVRAVDNDGLRATSATESYTVVSSTPGEAHLLITELVVTPSDGEYVEIFNPTSATIDLSDYYLTDGTFAGGGTYYYNIVTGSNAGGGDFGDFNARFPAGASIAPGATQTIAMIGSGFVNTYGIPPTYELYDTDGGIPNMREATPGSINGQGSLTNSGEVVILYYWDGQSDLVKDIDYLLWGDKAEAVDKSGVSIDGPDPDNLRSTYQNDTPIAQQIVISDADPHTFGESVKRPVPIEVGERLLGGNGITGHDETSEDLRTAFEVGVPDPGFVPVPGAPVINAVAFSPAEPTAQDPVSFSADVRDFDGTVTAVTLFSSVDGGAFTAAAMQLAAGDSLYRVTLPPQPDNALVQFFVEARDNDGNTTNSSPAFFVVGALQGVIPIATIQQNSVFFEGREVTIEGVVTLGAGIITSTRVDAYIQDNSGRGINIFDFDPPNPADHIDRFNRLRITGTITEFSGITEITAFQTSLQGTGQPLPRPLFVSSNLANDLSFEGTYMKVAGVVTSKVSDQGDNDMNITLQDDMGTVLVRVWENTGIDLRFLNVGDTATVQGVMDIFSSQSQIVPGYQDEITVPGKTNRADGSGFAFTSVTQVAPFDSLQALAVSLAGVISDSIRTVQIDLPKLWLWSGSAADVSLEGASVQNAAVNVIHSQRDDVFQIRLSNTTISQGDTARVVLHNLITPGEQITSVVWIRTAGEGGRLRFIPAPPRIRVGNAGRFLIYDLQTNSGEFSGSLTVRGVTTVGSGLLRQFSSAGDSLTTAYIQDESGRGINLFRFGLIDPLLQRGNEVEARGSVTEFNGVTEIEYTSLTLLSTDAPLPEPVSLTNAEANSPAWDGTLVKTAGVVLENFSAGGGTTLEIGDGNGTTNVRIWDTAGLNISAFVENTRIFVEGVSGLFISNGDSIFQLLPTYQDQISLDPSYSPTLDNVRLDIEPHPFAPDRGESIDIIYNAGAVNNRVTIRLFDLGGRLVTTLLDESAVLVENTLSWDGRDKLRDLVPLGAYICQIQVVEPGTGKTRSRTAPIVVGTVLSR